MGIDPVALSSSQIKNGKGSNSELDKGLNSNNNVLVSESAFHAATEAGLARPMFEVIGEALCSALSIAFGLANDPGRAAVALECARSAMRLAFETKLYTLRDLFGQFLCNATGVIVSGIDETTILMTKVTTVTRQELIQEPCNAPRRQKRFSIVQNPMAISSSSVKKFWKSCASIFA